MTRRFAIAALAAATLLGCSSKGPVRDPADLVDIKSPAFKPKVLWDRSPGDGTGDRHMSLRVSVGPDAVFTADHEGEVFALSPKDGHTLWHAQTRTRTVAGPSAAGDLVLIGTADAEVVALKRANGAAAWRASVSSEVLAPPVGSGGIVVVRCGDGKIFGLAADNGARKWSFDRAVPPLTLRGMSTPMINGNTVYAGLDNGHAIALDLATGEPKWEQVVSAPVGRTELERIVDVDAQIAESGDGVYAASFGGELAAIGVDEGRVGWRRPVKSYSGVAVVDGKLIVADEDGLVWAFDLESGAAVWKQEALKYRRVSPPAIQHGSIVVGDLDGWLHWLSPKDGTIVARKHALGDPVVAAPVVQDEVLYAVDTDGEVAAVTIP
ncbi:MAG TPA: outer membrane protein assembly factor BamB [Candidatus Binatia bacterium]|nr:outer membrane protein assembly factor BamB [Candidatus Binatia bacterium]